MKQLKDRVLEVSQTQGTGDYALAGAVTGFRAFSPAVNVGDTADYYAEEVDGTGVPSGAWETGMGTYATGNKLQRTTIYASSNGGTPINWGVGTRRVAISLTSQTLADAVNSAEIASGYVAAANAAKVAAQAAAAAAAASAATLDLSAPNPIGNVTPNSGAFTSLTATQPVTLGSVGVAGQVGQKNDAGVLAWVSGILGNTGQTRYSIYNTIVGREDFCVDAAGNLGIGVTPSAWGTTYKASQILRGSRYADNYVTGLSHNAYFDAGWRYIASAVPVTIYAQYLGGHTWYTAASGTAGDPIPFTQAMTLDAGGNLLLNTPSFGYSNSNSIMFSPGFGRQYLQHASGTPNGSGYVEFIWDSSVIGSISQLGTTAVAYNTTSDHRLKTNVRPADATRFMDIQFRDFEWGDGRHDCGVIAHELQQVYPDLVLGEKDATEVRTVEITPAVPAVTEQVLVTPEVPTAYDGDQIVTLGVAAVYETIEVTPAIPAVTEEQTFPVYQQVNYIGLIGRMGTRVQALQRTVDAQAALIAAMEARLSALEA